MSTFTWNESMSVGVKEIDDQHIAITEVINKLYYSYMEGQEHAVLAELINHINDYAQIHFATERKYMAPHAELIPNYEEHMQQHREFFSDAIGFLLRYLEDGAEITPELLDYLTDWWFKHINGTDKVMGRVLNEQGVF